MSVDFLQARALPLMTLQELEKLYSSADNQLINSCSNKRPKMLETKQNEIIRIFYPRNKRFSSDQWNPLALRFNRNAKKLLALGFHAPKVISLHYCLPIRTYVLVYEKLAGQDVRNLMQEGGGQTLLMDVIRCLAALHEKGVFFRSIHLGNLLYQEGNTIALIDIADVRFCSKPLSLLLRYRNIKHLLLCRDDKEIWKRLGVNAFLTIYFASSTLSAFSKKWLTFTLKRIQHA